MTAQVPATRQAQPPKPQIMAGGQVAALVPQSLDEAFRVSQAIAGSGLAPRGLDKPEQIMVAIMAGAELGLAPFQALQSFAVVNGRPTLWGDGLMAVARAQGIRAKEWMEGADDALTAHCEVTRPDTGEVIARSFSVADAKKASLWGKQGPWQSYPRRMLQMRARAWALRDGCADMLRGFQVREEVEDYQTTVRDVTPRTSGMRARLEARAVANEGFDPDHIEREASALGDDDIPDFDAPETQPGGAESEAPADADTGSAGADDSPGDRPSGESEAAGSAEANAKDETDPAAELLEWAANLKADLEGLSLEQIEAILASPNEQANFAKLEATQAQTALDLNRAIGRRKKELGA